MANNSPKSARSASLFARLEDFLQGVPLLSQGLPAHYLPRIIFCFVLGLSYIGGMHQHQQRLYRLTKLEGEVEEWRTAYMSRQAEYMWASKQSAIAKKAAELGLVDNTTPPIVLPPLPYEGK